MDKQSKNKPCAKREKMQEQKQRTQNLLQRLTTKVIEKASKRNVSFCKDREKCTSQLYITKEIEKACKRYVSFCKDREMWTDI